VDGRRFHFSGCKPLDYSKIYTGLLFVLQTGIAWHDLLFYMARSGLIHYQHASCLERGA
jgi:hypothetical protein